MKTSNFSGLCQLRVKLGQIQNVSLDLEQRIQLGLEKAPGKPPCPQGQGREEQLKELKEKTKEEKEEEEEEEIFEEEEEEEGKVPRLCDDCDMDYESQEALEFAKVIYNHQ